MRGGYSPARGLQNTNPKLVKYVYFLRAYFYLVSCNIFILVYNSDTFSTSPGQTCMRTTWNSVYRMSEIDKLTYNCMQNFIYVLVSISFIHLAVCLTTGPKPLPKRSLHIVRSAASFFKWESPLLSLRSSSSFLRLLPRLPVTSIPPFIFPSITRCRRQFLHKMWPIQLAFRLLISRRISSAPWL